MTQPRRNLKGQIVFDTAKIEQIQNLHRKSCTKFSFFLAPFTNTKKG